MSRGPAESDRSITGASLSVEGGEGDVVRLTNRRDVGLRRRAEERAGSDEYGTRVFPNTIRN
jgi:hypothetical protein